MAALSVFVPGILPHVPGCPAIAARLEALRAATEFCAMTKAWREWLAPIDVAAGTATYSLVLPTGSALTLPIEVKWGDIRLTPLTRDDALAAYGETWDSEYSASPEGYIMPDLSSITLAPTPDTALADGLNILAALQPAADATTVPDFLAEQYREIINHGAIGGLLGTQGKPWSNPQLGDRFSRMFASEVAGVSIRAAKGWSRRALRTTISPL